MKLDGRNASIAAIVAALSLPLGCSQNDDSHYFRPNERLKANRLNSITARLGSSPEDGEYKLLIKVLADLDNGASHYTVAQALRDSKCEGVSTQIIQLLLHSRPLNRAEHLNYQKQVALLRQLSSDIPEAISAQSDQYFDELLSQAMEWKRERPQFEELDITLRTLQRLLSVVNPPQRKKCLGALTEIQTKFLECDVSSVRLFGLDQLKHFHLISRLKHNHGARQIEDAHLWGRAPEHNTLEQLRDLLVHSKGWVCLLGEWHYVTQEDSKNSELWELTMKVDGNDFEVVLTKCSEAECFVRLDLETFTDFVTRGDTMGLVRAARSYYEAEQDPNMKDRLLSYDIPRNVKSMYIPVIPSDDGLSRQMALTSLCVGYALHQRYGMNISPIIFERQAFEALNERIAEGYRDGHRNFVVDFYEHGLPAYLDSPDRITAHMLATMTRIYPDCSFLFTGVPCNGAGFREGFQREFETYPGLSSKITVALPCKPQSANDIMQSHLSRQDAIEYTQSGGTAYCAAWVMNMLDPKVKTCGEAIFNAGKIAKKESQVDSEVLIGGVLIP